MMDPETTLLIGGLCGLAFGYALGFLLARAIYRSPTWPHINGQPEDKK